MSGGPKKHTQKHSLRALQTSREKKALEAKAITTRGVTGDPNVRKIGLWSEEEDLEISPMNDDFHRLCKEYVATNNVSRKADIIRQLRKMRKDVVAANKILVGGLGVVLCPLTNPAEDWTDQKMENALIGFNPRRLEPNPYGANLEFNYSPQVVTPWDAGYFVAQLADPVSRPMMKELMEWCFAYPTLLAILDKMREAAKARNDRPKFESIAGAWQEAVKHQRSIATLTRMRNLPDPYSTEIDETKSSAFPYSIMWQPGSHTPMDKVWHLTGSPTKDPITDRLPKDIKATLQYLTRGKAGAPDYDKRLLMYCLQAGNVKHIFRSEYGKKPDRGIYAAPLVTRLIGGAISQPFADNWYHPGDVTAESFMYGGAARIVAKMVGRYTRDDTVEQCLEKVLPLFELRKPTAESLKPVLPEGYTVDHHVRELHLKEGRFALPDKKWYDLLLRGEFMRDFAVYTEGVLPRPDDLVALSKETETPLDDKAAEKKVRAWMKVNKKLHHIDRHAPVVTNRRYAFSLDGEKSEDGNGNPSGSPWTTKRNTWTNLCEEDAADVLLWKELYPNRDIDWAETPVKCACGDDLSLYWRTWSDKQEKEWAARQKVIKRVGHVYKDETCTVSQNLSSLEFLGRRIYAFVDSNERVLGFFGVRPAIKVMASVVYPKHMPPKGASPDAYGTARLIAANDELGLFSGNLREGLRAIGDVFLSQGVKPIHDAFEEDAWWSPPKSNTFRGAGALAQLHLGGEMPSEMDSPGVDSTDTDDESDVSFSDDDLEPIAVPSPSAARKAAEVSSEQKEGAAADQDEKKKSGSAKAPKEDFEKSQQADKAKAPKKAETPPKRSDKKKPTPKKALPVKEKPKKKKKAQSDSDDSDVSI